jgi:hypothetical protein
MRGGEFLVELAGELFADFLRYFRFRHNDLYYKTSTRQRQQKITPRNRAGNRYGGGQMPLTALGNSINVPCCQDFAPDGVLDHAAWTLNSMVSIHARRIETTPGLEAFTLRTQQVPIILSCVGRRIPVTFSQEKRHFCPVQNFVLGNNRN